MPRLKGKARKEAKEANANNTAGPAKPDSQAKEAPNVEQANADTMTEQIAKIELLVVRLESALKRVVTVDQANREARAAPNTPGGRIRPSHELLNEYLGMIARSMLADSEYEEIWAATMMDTTNRAFLRDNQDDPRVKALLHRVMTAYITKSDVALAFAQDALDAATEAREDPDVLVEEEAARAELERILPSMRARVAGIAERRDKLLREMGWRQDASGGDSGSASNTQD